MENIKNRVPDVLIEEENGVIRYEYHSRMETSQVLVRWVTWIDIKNGFTLDLFSNPLGTCNGFLFLRYCTQIATVRHVHFSHR